LTVKDTLIKGGFEPAHAEIAMVAQNYTLLDAANSEKVMRLLENLEDLDDVQNVYMNAHFSEEMSE